MNEETILQRARAAWGEGIHVKDLLVIYPIGSRGDGDALILDRLTGHVTTGTVGTEKVCFEGDLEKFALRVEDDYRKRLTYNSSDAEKVRLQRCWDDYRDAIKLFESIMVRRARDLLYADAPPVE